jgi:hypothetical protein
MAIHTEEQIASLIAAAGVIWAVRAAVNSAIPAYAVQITVGPMETCAIGILIWLHAKYRRHRRRDERLIGTASASAHY